MVNSENKVTTGAFATENQVYSPSEMPSNKEETILYNRTYYLWKPQKSKFQARNSLSSKQICESSCPHGVHTLAGRRKTPETIITKDSNPIACA